MILQAVLCLLLFTTSALAQCGTAGQHSCGVVTSRSDCPTENCCWSGSSCEYRASGGRRASGKNDYSKYLRELTASANAFKKPRTTADWNPVASVARNQNLESEEAGISRATSRGVKRNFFGPSFGSIGGQSSAFALIAGLQFPKCPVDVKVCHRAPCGGQAGQNDWVACLRSPLCCFDHTLNFYRRFLGPQYMRQAPVCYSGPTSSQWQHVTRLIRPWNPWFTSVVVDVFRSIFNTALINVGGKAACALSGITQSTQCGHTGLSEEGCNLKGCCYSATRSIRCIYASPEAQRYFGNREVYPELFTQDPAETQCSRNVFSLGPRAYSRLPCAGNTLPTNAFELTLNYCPQQYCCLNYLALSDKFGDLAGLSQLSQGGLSGAFSSFGGLRGLAPGGIGNPFGGGIRNPFGGGVSPFGGGGVSPFGGGAGGLSSLLTLSLLGNNNNTGNSSLSKIFCPYYFVRLSSSFPDLTDSVATCCNIPACYHKKQFLSGGGGPIQPPIGNRATFTNWSPWTNCNAQCGSIGQLSRSRRCTYGGNPSNIAPPNQCPGPSSETRQCQGQPCISRGRWSAWNQGQCSVTCGQGTSQYFRQCTTPNGQQVNDCSGASREQRQCNLAPCVSTFNWGAWSPGPCSAQCGTGQATYTRQCLYQSSTPVSSNNCGGGSTTDRRQCNAGPCRQVAIFGTARVSGSCSVTCGTGTQNYIKSCIYQNTGTPAPQSACAYLGSTIEQRTCQKAPCRSVIYSEWSTYAPCGATCGSTGVEVYYRQCYYNDGRRTPAPANLCDSSRKVVACPKQACQTSGYNWAGWSNWSQCTNYNGQCSSRQELNCYQFNGVKYQMVPQQSLCPGNFPTRVRTKQCSYQECNTQG